MKPNSLVPPAAVSALARVVLACGLVGLFGCGAMAADGAPATTLRPRQSAMDSSPPVARPAPPTATRSPWDDELPDSAGVAPRMNVGRPPVARAQPAAYYESERDFDSSGSTRPNASRESDTATRPTEQVASLQLPKSVLTLAPPPTANDADRSQRSVPSLATMLGGLAVVIGLFLLAAWLLRLSMPKAAPTLPREAWEVLGRAPLAGRQHVQLVRCGNKMLLLSVTPGGAETLTEITDPVEVDRLSGVCQQARPNSATANFRQLLDGFAREPQVDRRRDRDFDRLTLAGEDIALG